MDVDHYLQLSRDDSTLLYSTQESGTVYRVHEHGRQRWVYTGGASVLSLMQLDDPAQPVLPNHVAMLGAQIFTGIPRSVLNLGSGIGTFERFFRARCPQSDVVSVDTSKALIDIARRYFDIDPDHPVIEQPAELFLRGNERKFDLVLCDVFDGDVHPDCLTDDDFYRDAARSLAAGGAMAINLSPTTEQALIEILYSLRRSFPVTAMVNLVDYGNLVVYAMMQALEDGATMTHTAVTLGRSLGLGFSHIAKHLTILPGTGSVV